MGTSWEHIGKKGGRKKSLFTPFKKKKTISFMSAC
jgi:hypothetical protein